MANIVINKYFPDMKAFSFFFSLSGVSLSKQSTTLMKSLMKLKKLDLELTWRDVWVVLLLILFSCAYKLNTIR